jgi:hypothetical protein
VSIKDTLGRWQLGNLGTADLHRHSMTCRGADRPVCQLKAPGILASSTGKVAAAATSAAAFSSRTGQGVSCRWARRAAGDKQAEGRLRIVGRVVIRRLGKTVTASAGQRVQGVALRRLAVLSVLPAQRTSSQHVTIPDNTASGPAPCRLLPSGQRGRLIRADDSSRAQPLSSRASAHEAAYSRRSP